MLSTAVLTSDGVAPPAAAMLLSKAPMVTAPTRLILLACMVTLLMLGLLRL